MTLLEQIEIYAMERLAETSFKGGVGQILAITDDQFQYFLHVHSLMCAVHQQRAIKTADGRLIVEPMAGLPNDGWVVIPWEPEATLIQRFVAERVRVRASFEKRRDEAQRPTSTRGPK